ncbi:SDR family NAD(P)-dependent oxidoreductase [Deminuibacter soli]|uniref:SDR family NAD(P)-dependent oxidoreductase n=1 Tax=Deminuibacter soli TaxID=2291815 RepID=A0A3E1NIM5_9BACT|nr:SDR family oxidoreductase [Deminuibacter soli]RFM27674.1 SDR family NAD(P)-dependent oxidoreductase [Deminuibacter soli]
MKYALITGASKGIGKDIANELAARQYNVLLIARDSTQLQAAAQEISHTHKVDAQYLSIDLSKPDAAQEVFNWCTQNKFDISVLVNNAGYGLNGVFGTHSLSENNNMMQVNMNVLVDLCALLLPQLKAQPKAYILNIASSAAYQAVPYLSLYAASKAFVLTFSRGLHYELRKSPVSVTCVCPGATDTNFASRANITSAKAIKAAEKFNMAPQTVARIAVEGMLAGKKEVITGALNKLAAFFVWLLPKSVAEKTAAGIYE